MIGAQHIRLRESSGLAPTRLKCADLVADLPLGHRARLAVAHRFLPVLGPEEEYCEGIIGLPHMSAVGLGLAPLPFVGRPESWLALP